MKLLNNPSHFVLRKIKILSKNIQSPETAYNIWAENYDNEQNNLMLFYDNIIVQQLIYKINLKEKVILDYGCGTGRNWNSILKFNPAKIIGCDISGEMLKKLKSKFVDAEVHVNKGNKLPFLLDKQVDIIMSTLVMAHIKNIKKTFAEWIRVLNNTGTIIITDFHPELLAAGGSRTFNHNNKTITIQNYIHSIKEIESLLSSFGFGTLKLIEKKIDADVKHFYAINNALPVYDKFNGIPFIYGMMLSRQNADK